MIKTEFNITADIFLPYPKGFKDCSDELINFFKHLIGLIPDEINQYIIVNNQMAKDDIESHYPNKKINTIVIGNFHEIWLRDILGLNISKTKIYLPKYEPDYCQYQYTNDYLIEIRYQAKQIIQNTIRKEIVDFPIILDGGNFVSNGEMCFITDKILADNFLGKEEIEKIFVKYLGIKPIIVPSNPHDKLSHTDGYMNFLSKDRICLSDYPKNLDFLKSDVKYLESIKSILQDQNLSITTIYDRPVDEIVKGSGLTEDDNSSNCLSSARGVYVNFIVLNNTIILPEYTLPNYKRTMDHNTINKKIFEISGYKVLSINCDELSKLGGSLHCCSYTN